MPSACLNGLFNMNSEVKCCLWDRWDSCHCIPLHDSFG